MITQDHAWRLTRRRRDDDILLREGGPHRLDGCGDRCSQIEHVTRAFAGARERAQTVEEPLHPSDLARDNPAEVVDEPIVAAPARLNRLIWPVASTATTPLSIVETMLLRCSLASTTCA